MNDALIIGTLAAAVAAGTPLLFAALGEILTQRTGVMNLGVEGMMLVGALAGYGVTVRTESPALGFLAAMAAAAVLGLLHAFLTITLRVDQVVSGLGMTIFGSGLATYVGRTLVGVPLKASVKVGVLPIPILSDIPVLGRILFRHDPLVYLGMILAVVGWFVLYHTRFGLRVRAVGESPATADTMAVNVFLYRYAGVLIGAMLCGIAGAYISLVYAPAWANGITAGRGWIAIALVLFAQWQPLWALVGSYMFGAIEALSFRVQALGSAVPSHFLQMTPYLFTIIVLILVAVGYRGGPSLTLNVPYNREDR